MQEASAKFSPREGEKRILGMQTIRQVGRTALKTIWVMANEYSINIRTDHRFVAWHRGSCLQSENSDAEPYETIDFFYLRKVIRTLDPRPDDVFYDVGCGMGRILCLVARKKVKRCVGVEIDPVLCEIARQNAARMYGRIAPIDVLCMDASRADFSDGTMYFFFNPFGPETLNKVIVNIENSLSEHPRKIRIVYYNALHEEVLHSCAFLNLYHAFHSLRGQRVSFWTNLPNSIA
jgi:SAM-dependent methyltransferase